MLVKLSQFRLFTLLVLGCLVLTGCILSSQYSERGYEQALALYAAVVVVAGVDGVEAGQLGRARGEQEAEGDGEESQVAHGSVLHGYRNQTW